MTAAGAVLLELLQNRASTEEESVTDCTTMLHDGWQETGGDGDRGREREREGGSGRERKRYRNMALCM